MKDSKLTLLGTGTCQLEESRRASSALVELESCRLVFDLGRGIADRLAALGLRQDDVRHIVFSHFHPDHLSDLIPYLQAATWSKVDPRSVDLHLWGPRGHESQMMRLLSLFEAGVLTPPPLLGEWRVHLHEVGSGEGLEIEGRRFAFDPLPPAGNHGLRFEQGGEVVGLTGDAFFGPELVDFLSRCTLGVFDSGHLEEDEIVELAARCQTPRLVCSHVYRPLDVRALEARARERGFKGRLTMGHDLDRFSLSGVAPADRGAG